MLRPFSIITIEQITPHYYKDLTGLSFKLERKKKLIIDFVSEYEIEKGWERHTDTCTIKFPKNVVLQSGDFTFKESGTYNVILGGTERNVAADGTDLSGVPPLIMKGDKITVEDGYWYKNEIWEDVQVKTTRFKGFVSAVDSGTPIEIKCEDNFYLLKRVQLDVGKWKTELISLCKHIVDLVNQKFHNSDSRFPLLKFTDKVDSLTANFSLGYLEIEDMTCAQLLAKIRKQYKLESFFVDDTLSFGFPIYNEQDANSKNFFEFENTIIEENLEYTNKGDIELSATVHCVTINPTKRKTRDGEIATKRSKKSILIYYDLVSDSFKYLKKETGAPFPPNEGGERRDFVYAIDPSKGEPSDETLFEYGKQQLQKYFYTGFSGDFTTIGFPFVNWGDNVNLVSKIFADKNGQYKVKKIVHSGGARKGLKQQIHIDYKLNVPVPKSVKKISMM